VTIMLRTSPALKLFAVLLLANSGAALAQTKPSDAPPKLERVEEGSETPVTIVPKRDERRKIKETRDGGQVKEVQVKSGKSVYTMKGAHPGSVSENSAGAGSTLRPPQWTVLEFDLGRKKQAQRDEEAAAAAAAAPPAAVPPPPPPAK
jgi:hypothetical protein